MKADSKHLEGKNYGLEKLNLHYGWNLVGLGIDIKVQDLKEVNVKYVWKYNNGKWSIWGDNLDEKFYLLYNKINNIKAGEGVWVYVNH